MATDLASKVAFQEGAINSVLVSSEGKATAIYGVANNAIENCEQVLLTHHRRDVVWKAQPAMIAGVAVMAPEAEREWLENTATYWNGFTKSRFHDYACLTTKIVPHGINVSRWLKEGDVVQWRGLEFKVLDTPGYTRGAISYLLECDGKKLAFTGDLIYGDGKLIDLYSFQDAIPEASIRGYHGYAARLSQLVESLKKIAACQPDMLVPARGPVITNPQASIKKLLERVSAIYGNYLSTNALHWYFKEERMKSCGERVLGKGAAIQLMPYSLHEKAPEWVYENATSRLLISESGAGFLLDCGYQRVIDAVQKLVESGVIKGVEGIFVTHYHDDHTDMVQAAAEKFRCPVYATPEYVDILKNPGAYRMPALTANGIRDIQVVESGHQMTWNEFELTFHFFPGQTLYHGALLVRKPNERPIFFIGDALAPSGIDDYCLLNRNLVHDDGGFNLCFKKLREISQPIWLVNEHIPFVFQFSDAELSYLESRYRQRNEILKELFPWDAPNYGVDEQWAVFYPYAVTAPKNRAIELAVQVTNHSPIRRDFVIAPKVTNSSMRLSSAQESITLEPGQQGSVRFSVNVGSATGNHLVTGSVRSAGMEFNEWIEALVTVE